MPYKDPFEQNFWHREMMRKRRLKARANRKCEYCNIFLSIYNPNNICAPCERMISHTEPLKTIKGY